MAFLLMIATVAIIALSLGLGWWIWENLINNPLPYRDPEAITNEPWGGVWGVRTADGRVSLPLASTLMSNRGLSHPPNVPVPLQPHR